MVSADNETLRNSNNMCVSVQSVVCKYRFIDGGRVTPVPHLFVSTPQFIEPTDSLPRCSAAAAVSHVSAHKVQKRRQMRCIYHVQTVGPTSLPPKQRSAKFAVVNNSECDAAYRRNQGSRDLQRP